MAGLSILDRIIATEKNAAGASPFSRVLSFVPEIGRYKEEHSNAILIRDLELLLNEVSLDQTIALAAYPEVTTSVLNFGAPRVGTVLEIEAYADAWESKIAAFEPRLRNVSVRVAGTADSDARRFDASTITNANGLVRLRVTAEFATEAEEGEAFVAESEVALEYGRVEVTE